MVLIGPSSQSNSEEYKYQLLSIVDLKIKSISSPVLADSTEVEVVHFAGASTCAEAEMEKAKAPMNTLGRR